jgi:hypothetical protein
MPEANGAREDEFVRARRDDIDHSGRLMTIVGKRGRHRIGLGPFQGYALVRALPAYVGSSMLSNRSLQPLGHLSGTRRQASLAGLSACVAKAGVEMGIDPANTGQGRQSQDGPPCGQI